MSSVNEEILDSFLFESLILYLKKIYSSYKESTDVFKIRNGNNKNT
jgi:hypothetical protein